MKGLKLKPNLRMAKAPTKFAASSTANNPWTRLQQKQQQQERQHQQFTATTAKSQGFSFQLAAPKMRTTPNTQNKATLNAIIVCSKKVTIAS